LSKDSHELNASCEKGFDPIKINEFKLSKGQLHLPFNYEGSPELPSSLVYAYKPGVKFINHNPELVHVETVTEGSSSDSTCFKISVIADASNYTQEQRAHIGFQYQKEKKEFVIHIDHIVSAQIERQSTTLYFNYSQNNFYLQPKNSAGDDFDSLIGYPVQWKIDEEYLYQIPDEANVMAQTAETYEKSMIFLNGRQLGSTQLRASIPTDKNDNTFIEAEPINLKVIDAIGWFPQELYLPFKGTTGQAHVCSRKGHLDSEPLTECKIEYTPCDKDQFEIVSLNPEVATVDQAGNVIAVGPGDAIITVTDTQDSHNTDKLRVHVGARGSWPEQWIASGDTPRTDTIIITDEFNKPFSNAIIPSDIKWIFEGDLISECVEGRPIKAIYENLVIVGTVHVCLPPVITPAENRILVGSVKSMKLTIAHGSGEFTWETSNKSGVISVDPHQTVTIKKPGEDTVLAHDKRIPKFTATSHFLIENVGEIIISTDREEYFHDELLQPSITILGEHGNKFSVDDRFIKIESSNTGVFTPKPNLSLIANKVGFSDIYVTFLDKRSNVLHLSSIQHLSTDSPLVVNDREPADLKTRFGPQRFTPDQGQIRSVTCPSLSQSDYSYDEVHDQLTFQGQFKAQCTLTVQNVANDMNPHPVSDFFTFQVSSTKIGSLRINISDPLASNLPECMELEGYIPSTPITVTSGAVYRIPLDYRLLFTVEAVDLAGDVIGVYSKPGLRITADGAERAEGSSYFKITGPNRAALTFSADSETSVSPITFYVDPIHPHSLTPDSLHLFRYSSEPNIAEVINGSGHFQLNGGSNATLSSRTLTVYPNGERSRTISIRDICIPPNIAKVSVSTLIPDEIRITGDHYALVNTTVRLTAHLYSNGEQLEDTFFRLMNTTFTPDDGSVTPVKDTYNEFDVSLSSLGRFIFKLQAGDLSAQHSIDVQDRFKFVEDEMIVWKGETKPLPLSTGKFFGKITIHSADPSTVTVYGQSVYGVEVGTTTVTAKSDLFNYTASIVVHVIEVENVTIEGSTSTWEGARIAYTAHVSLIGNAIPPSNLAEQVQWSVDGSDDYYVKYDNTMVVHFPSVGKALVRAEIRGRQTTLAIDVDHRLEWATPSVITLPLGTTFDLAVRHSLKVEYDGQGLPIDNGTITAATEGYYGVRAKYGLQQIVCMVIVTKPKRLLLEPVGNSAFRPRLIDPDDHEYTSTRGAEYGWNSTTEPRKEGDIFVFDDAVLLVEPEIVMLSVSLGSLWNVSDCGRLFGNELIAPSDPIVVEGYVVNFQCAAEGRQWESSTKRVATIAQSGLATAHHRGKTIISCSREQRTTLEVVSVLGVKLSPNDIEVGKAEEQPLQIIPMLSNQRIDASVVRFAPDLEYSCSWDADECGAVVHEKRNGVDYCVIKRAKEYFCPMQSTVTVRMHSKMSDIDYSGNAQIIHYSDILENRGPFMNMTLNDADAKHGVHIGYITGCQQIGVTGVNSDQFSYQCNKNGADIKFLGDGLNETKLELLDPKTGEKARILIRRGLYSISNNYLDKNRSFPSTVRSYFIVLLILVGMYLLYKIGLNGILPPRSPFIRK